ncbi:MAG: ORF6N domain-containing protein [Candidatus Firestonebacteria bacterium]|nr:ORF6N domain-containing protein [Candidatus Firestonebacteria bacterium]
MEIVPLERIEKRIYVIRGQKVMLDRDLAELYGVKTRRLNEQVSRNLERFPDDFMFRFTPEEAKNLRSQFATSSWGGLRRAPYAITTELGVAMLSSVLKNPGAVQANIQIMRAFVRLRALQEDQKQILSQINKHEIKLLKHDRQFSEVFQTLDSMRSAPETGKKKKTGFTNEA